MRKDAPEIVLLRQKIEESIGRKVRTPADFEFLAGVIWERTHETISPTTLKRLWGYIDGADTTRLSTLHLLSRFVGYKDWDDYCMCIAQESDCETDTIVAHHISVNSLSMGDCLEIAWLPNRRCLLRYTGGNSWLVVEAENSKLKVGNTFQCSMFIQGEPLYIDELVQGNNPPVAFVIGNKRGLTLLNKIAIEQEDSSLNSKL